MTTQKNIQQSRYHIISYYQKTYKLINYHVHKLNYSILTTVNSQPWIHRPRETAAAQLERVIYTCCSILF